MQGEAKLLDFAGTPYYIAPEIIKEERYGSKCDIWSLGILTFKLISGDYPFGAPNCKVLYEAIKRGIFTFDSSIWARVTPEAKDFI